MEDSTKFYLLLLATAVLLGIGIPVSVMQDDDSELLAGIVLTVLGSFSFVATVGQAYLMYAANNGGNSGRLKRFEVL